MNAWIRTAGSLIERLKRMPCDENRPETQVLAYLTNLPINTMKTPPDIFGVVRVRPQAPDSGRLFLLVFEIFRIQFFGALRAYAVTKGCLGVLRDIFLYLLIFILFGPYPFARGADR